MNEERKYTKLGDLVGKTFTVEKVWGYNWQMWDNVNKKMLRSDTWEKGYQKKWQVVTDKGQMDLGTGQFSGLLEGVYSPKEDNASIVGRTFQVKSNGKTGMEIRYYLNPVKTEEPEEEKDVVIDDIDEEPVDLSDIPF